jgi:hypothetical protein
MGSIAMGRSLIVGASMGSTTMDRSIVFASMGSTIMGRSIVFALNGLYHNGQINGLFQLLSAPPLLRNPFLMSILPWNFRKFTCKIYPFPWNFLVKITLAHGISILNL